MSVSSGILLIDKPTGMTSHDVVAIVRKKLNVKKVGHAGTLDPLATGLLIILVGREYTKRQTEFMAGEKEYLCTAQLGLETDTYDIDGKVIKEFNWQEIKKIKEDLSRAKSREKLEKILKKFTGKIQQQVPAFSAVKVKGKKLYEKARQGEILEQDLPVREVEIKELELVDFTSPLASSLGSDSSSSPKGEESTKKAFFTLKIVCSKGTYVRSLVHDIGKELGTAATVVELRRTRSGGFDIKNAQNLDNLNLVSSM